MTYIPVAFTPVGESLRAAARRMGATVHYDRSTGYYVGVCTQCDKPFARLSTTDAIAAASRCADTHDPLDGITATVRQGAVGPYYTVARGESVLGYIADRGFYSRSGEWLPRWSVFRGGSEVDRDLPTRDEAIRALRDRDSRGW